MNRNRGHLYAGSQQQQQQQHQHHHQQQQQSQAYHSNYGYHNPHDFAHPQNNQHPDDHRHHHHHHTTGQHSLSYTSTEGSSDVSSRSSKYRRQPRGRGYKCLRGFFSSCNFVFWLLGCAILGAGIWLHFSKSEYHAVLPISSNDYLCSATLAIAFGATILVVGFLGCCGSLMQIRCMLLAYFIIVMMLVLIECGIGLMGFAYKDEINSSVKQELRKTIAVAKRGHVADEETDEDRRIRTAWDSLQREWYCCGVDGYHDWTGTSKSSFGEKVVMAYSLHHGTRDHHHHNHNNRGTKKHHHHRSSGKQRKEEILFIPDSCCRIEKSTRQQQQQQQQQHRRPIQSGKSSSVGETRKKKKEAGGDDEEKPLSCATGVPVSHLKKLISDSSSSSSFFSSSSSFSSTSPVHLDGCYSGLKAWFVRHQAPLSYSVLGLAVLQFLGLLAAMMLFCVLGEYGRFW